MVRQLFFVHGTGVRQSGYARTLADIQNRLAEAGRPEIAVSGVSWGELEGVSVTAPLIEGMLPPGAAKGDAPTDPEMQAALWGALMEDPLFELRALSLRGPEGRPRPSTTRDRSPAESLLKALGAFVLPEDPIGGVSPQALAGAAAWVGAGAAKDGGGDFVMRAVHAAGGLDPTLVEVVARAIVAAALLQSRGEPGGGPDALYVRDQRDALVEQVATALSEGTKGGIDAWFKDRLKGWALAKATAKGRDRRTGLMLAASPGTGDILYSQRRGEKILDLLRARIEDLGADTAVIGHSLGGVHLVNLLSRPDRPKNVIKLVTVGSQSAFFAACDAMGDIRKDGVLPAGFPSWLNIYDRSDFLSFCAERSFRSGQVKDVEIASGMPFPDSHGAYWRHAATYKAIAAFL